MAKILALDLGKYKSVSYLVSDHQPGVCGTQVKVTGVFGTHVTAPAVLHDLLVEVTPDVVVIEVGSVTGWVVDLCQGLGIEAVVANSNDERWEWRNVKRKTDRDDAVKLAEMYMAGTLPRVHVPVREVRKWRELIEYRSALVRRRTAVRNTMHAILVREGMVLAARGHSGWTDKRLAGLREHAKELSACGPGELWRGMLGLELTALDQLSGQLQAVERKLDELAENNPSVKLLRTIPGVGARLSELVVAVLDEPGRFGNARQVGAYVGLVPRQYESGQSSRQGRITRRGHALLRGILVEVAWLMLRHNPYFAGVFGRVARGTKARRKIAAVATSRRVLVTCWAMLRDNKPWRDPRRVGVGKTAGAV